MEIPCNRVNVKVHSPRSTPCSVFAVVKPYELNTKMGTSCVRHSSTKSANIDECSGETWLVGRKYAVK